MTGQNQATMVVYISGKISGLPDLNKPKFEAAARQLRSLGFIVRNPHDICDGVPPEEWHLCMRKCIAAMMDCDIILLLDDWFDSLGAVMEQRLAVSVGMEVDHYETFIQQFKLSKSDNAA